MKLFSEGGCRPTHTPACASSNRSVADLQADITTFIDRHNSDPKPFRWTKSADDILASIERFCLYNAPAPHR